MKTFLALAAILATLLVSGCDPGPDKKVDANKTPPPQYVMVPAQNSGGTSGK